MALKIFSSNRVKEAAESLNISLRKLVEAQDDQPTPTVAYAGDHTLDSAHDKPDDDAQIAAPAWVTLC